MAAAAHLLFLALTYIPSSLKIAHKMPEAVDVAESKYSKVIDQLKSENDAIEKDRGRLLDWIKKLPQKLINTPKEATPTVAIKEMEMNALTPTQLLHADDADDTENALKIKIITSLIDMIYCYGKVGTKKQTLQQKFNELMEQIDEQIDSVKNKDIRIKQLEQSWNDNNKLNEDYIAEINAFKERMRNNESEMEDKNERIKGLENTMKEQALIITDDHNRELEERFNALQHEHQLLLKSNQDKIAEIKLLRDSWKQTNDKYESLVIRFQRSINEKKIDGASKVIKRDNKSTVVFEKLKVLLEQIDEYLQKSKTSELQKDERINELTESIKEKDSIVQHHIDENMESDKIKNAQISVLESLNELYQKEIASKNQMLKSSTQQIEDTSENTQALREKLADSEKRHTEKFWKIEDLQDENDNLLLQIDEQIQIIENNDIRYKYNEKLLLIHNKEIVQLNGCVVSLKKELREKWSLISKKDKMIRNLEKERTENVNLRMVKNKKVLSLELMTMNFEKYKARKESHLLSKCEEIRRLETKVHEMYEEAGDLRCDLLEKQTMKNKNILHLELMKNINGEMAKQIDEQQQCMEAKDCKHLDKMKEIMQALLLQKRTIHGLQKDKEALKEEINHYKTESIDLKEKQAEFVSIEYQKNELLEMQLKHHFETVCR